MSAGDPDADFFEVEGRRGPAKTATAERERHEDEPRGKRKKRSFFRGSVSSTRRGPSPAR